VFRNSIGISPKHYALLKKFHSAVSRLKTSSSLTELALDLNYYDQAHFIKDFKSFAGVCPTVIKKEKNTLNKINELEYYNP
jgi:methylphosphotriester-DNA--protein-cysteine methyltransferase